MNATATAAGAAFRALRRLAQPRPPAEACDFCSVPLFPAHRHLVEVETRKIICVCDACALRFEGTIARWKLVPRDARRLPEFQLADGQWEALAIPINLAFLFHSTPARRVIAMYPSPGGATESLLPLSSWDALVAANPSLARLEPDVEALLIKRIGDPEYYRAPIDLCFELVGLIRVHWKGLSGGTEVWKHIEQFFARLRSMSPASATRAEVAHA